MPAGANQGIPLSCSAGLLPCDTAMFMRSVLSGHLHRGPQIACRTLGRQEYAGKQRCVHPVYLLAAAPPGKLGRQTLLSLPGLQWLCSEPSPQAQEVEEVSAESITQGVQACHVVRDHSRKREHRHHAAHADLFPLFWALESIAKGCL